MVGQTVRESSHPTSLDDAPALAYFVAVRTAFREAQLRAGSVMRYFDVAGRTICLQFAGPALVPYVEPALLHLAVAPETTPDLTIGVWDSSSTGTPLPAVPWRMRDTSPRGSVAGYNTARMRTAFQGEIDTLSLLDRATSRAIFWVREPQAVPPWDRAAPLRAIFHWMVDSPTGQVVHAAALGTEGAGAVLVGKGGSGKSTTTLLCLKHGLRYVGDDYIALSTEGEPRAWSLYSSAKLNPDSLALLPHLETAVSNHDRAPDEKALIFLHQAYPERLAASLPARVVIVPRIAAGQETRLLPVSRALGLRALAPSSILQLPDAEQGAWHTMVDFVRRVPCYELQIGRESSIIPTLIDELLQGLAD